MPLNQAPYAVRGGIVRRAVVDEHGGAEQRELNYDLYGMSAREILTLLPGEFSAFLWSGGLQSVEAVPR